MINEKSVKIETFMKTNTQLSKPQTQLTTLPAGTPPANGDARHLTGGSPTVANFLAARASLQQRQQDLENELADIQKLLKGECHLPLPMKAALPPVPISPRRRHNVGLTRTVATLLADGPLTKDQIVEQLLARNFEFFGNPKTALDPVLYGKKFQRDGGLFRLAVAP